MIRQRHAAAAAAAAAALFMMILITTVLVAASTAIVLHCFRHMQTMFVLSAVLSCRLCGFCDVRIRIFETVETARDNWC